MGQPARLDLHGRQAAGRHSQAVDGRNLGSGPDEPPRAEKDRHGRRHVPRDQGLSEQEESHARQWPDAGAGRRTQLLYRSGRRAERRRRSLRHGTPGLEMPSIIPALEWLEGLAWTTAIRESPWGYPIIETAH